MTQLRARARRFWREYTRMRTAILFLIGLIALVLVGSFVPQQDTSAQTKVDDFLAGHHSLNALGTTLGLPLTEVFVSPLFFALLASLYIALAACVLRRGRALVVRTLRGHPRTPQYWGEWGSWLFHASFFVLLVAVCWGKATGYQGIVTVTEGQRVTEARSDYDTIQEGLLFDGRHAGYQVQLNRFAATYQASGAPRDFVSNVTVFDRGRAVQTRDIRVNEFLGYRGVDFYQQDYGWSPRVVVRNPQGRVVYDGFLQFFGGMKNVQTGVLKVPDFGYTIPGGRAPVQLGAKLAIFPDARTTVPLAADGTLDTANPQYAPGGQEARNPVLQVQLYVGDLGLNSGRTQDVNGLDTARMTPYFADAHAVPLPLRGSLPLVLPGPSGQPVTFSVAFPELRQYSLFLVKRDNGVPLVYLSFGTIMTGLMVKLYIKPAVESRLRRRRRGLPAAERGGGPNPAPEPERELVSAGSDRDWSSQ
ncbi:MAG: cytochrome c biogenesis protein ResB [Candidatus Dormibacteria bacterium]